MATRRGWGRLRKLPSGSWQAAYTGPDLVVYAAPHTFRAKIDAEGWLAGERRQIDRGDWAPPTVRIQARRREATTFGAYAATWLEQRRTSGRIKPRTAELYASILNRHILPTFAGQPIGRITPVDVKSWHAALKTGPSGRANAYGLLRTIMGDAVDDDLLLANPVHIKAAGQKRRQRELRVLTVAQLNTAIDALPARYQTLALVAAWCSLRFGEVAGLRREDVDLHAGVLHIRHSVVTLRNGERFLGPPKSDAGVRDVTIPPHVVEPVRRHLDEHSGPVLVFPAAGGRDFLAESTLYKVWQRARAKAGRPDVRVHDLRHFGLIMAARAGATLGELQQRGGHSTAQAAAIYQSAVSDRHAEIAAAMSGFATP